MGADIIRPHGEPPFPIREDRLHNKQHIMPECKIASVYAVYAVGAFIGRPPSNDRKFMMKINCINGIHLPK